jgi:hypothetical protein
MHSRLIVPLVMLTAACLAGCHTETAPVARHQTAAALPGKILPKQARLFVLAAGAVLHAHGFVPLIPIQGAGPTDTLVSARPRAPGQLILAVIRMTPDPRREVVVDLTAYQQVGSEWPSLGRLFREPIDREERAMRSEIEAKLAAPRP